jgi:serine/threonine-protein kinase
LTPTGDWKNGSRPVGEAKDDYIGRVIGGYRVVRRLGGGSTGTVYLLQHRELAAFQALKVLGAEHRADPERARRFADEARALAALRHASVVKVIDFARFPDGTPYLVMEYLDGEPLSQRLAREGALSPGETVALLVDVCGALGAAFKRGIVHRDLKPSNLFLEKAPPGSEVPYFVKVLDFGIARLVADLAGPVATAPGVVLGTPAYMSPEQARGQSGRVDHRSDLYSLGCVAWECLAGRPPFVAATAEDYARCHLEEVPPPLRAVRPDVPETLELAIARVLEKDAFKRFQTPESFAEALELAARPGSTRDDMKALFAIPTLAADPEDTTHRATAGELALVARVPGPSLVKEDPSPQRRPSDERPKPASSGRGEPRRTGRSWPWFALAATVALLAVGLVFRLGCAHSAHSATKASLAHPVGAP